MNSSTPPFTLLMALWKGDEPTEVAEALRSATLGQDLQPTHLVLTIDGHLPPALETIVDRVEQGAYGPATVVRSRTHGGLATALTRGLAACPTEIVARADADDLNAPERFDIQIPYIAAHNLDVLGSAMREIGTGKLRSRPTSEEEIRAYVRDHNPFQHPTVVFRASAVRQAGGYRDLPFMEDWYLWYRMLRQGARVANLAEPLVDYRVNEGLFRRRGGLAPLQSDVILQRTMLRDGATTPLRAARNIAARFAYRTVGPRARALMYATLIEHRRPSANAYPLDVNTSASRAPKPPAQVEGASVKANQSFER